MSLAINTRRNFYLGNGVDTVFPYTFKLLASSDLIVMTRNETTKAVFGPLVLGTDYSIDGVGNGAGGSITLLAGALASGHSIVLYSDTPMTQTNNIGNKAAFYPSDLETEFDKLTMLSQELRRKLASAILLHPTEDPDDFDPTLPADFAGNPGATLMQNPAGNGFLTGPSLVDLMAGIGITAQVIDTSGGPMAYSLPKASNNNKKVIAVFNSGFNSGNDVTVGLVDAGDTINEESGDVVTSGDCRIYYADGANDIWLVLK